MDFLDFCKIKFDNIYPEILVDIVYYLSRYRIQHMINPKEQINDKSYRSALES